MYTSPMIIKTEMRILKVFNYNLMIRDYLLDDKIGLYLCFIQDMLNESDFIVLYRYVSAHKSLNNT